MLHVTGMEEIVVVAMSTPNSAQHANVWILLNKEVVNPLNGKEMATVMMVKLNFWIIQSVRNISFLFICKVTTMLDAVLMVVIVVDTTSTPNSAANANV